MNNNIEQFETTAQPELIIEEITDESEKFHDIYADKVGNDLRDILVFLTAKVEELNCRVQNLENS